MIIIFEGDFPKPVAHPIPGMNVIQKSVWDERKEVSFPLGDELSYYKPNSFFEFACGDSKLVCLPRCLPKITLPEDHITKIRKKWEKDNCFLKDTKLYVVIHNNDLPDTAKKTLDNTFRDGDVIYFTHGGTWYKNLINSIIQCISVEQLLSAYSEAIASVKENEAPKRISFEENKDCFNTVYLDQQDFDVNDNISPLSEKISAMDNSKPNLFSYTDAAFKNFNDFNGPEGDNLTRHRRYIDSSIWNMAVHEPDDIAPLLLKRNSDKGLYKLTIAEEYYELHKRILKNSYLKKADGGGSKAGHAEDVSPFVFHSEAYMRKLIDERYSCNLQERLKSELQTDKPCKESVLNNSSLKLYKWRILLCDDHANKWMTVKESEVKNSEEKKSIEITKSQIISDILTDAGFSVAVASFDETEKLKIQESTESADKDVMLHCASSIDVAMKALQSYEYEIVLMDYLFKADNDRSSSYGYQMLNALVDKSDGICIPKRNIYKFGPHDRLYFSFISAFTTAVNERLLAEGLHKSEKFWHIADGACPTNTPYLFLYNLLHLMNKRVEDMGIPKLSKINRQDFKEVSEGKVPYVKEYIIDEIFNDPNIRQKANDKFDDVLSLLYHYKKLIKNTDNTAKVFESKGSVLATEFIKANPSLGGFLEHLTQLVYLTAFGTVRQWPEMWEEYQFISSIVGPQPRIEEYIFKLKSNNI